MKVRFGHLTIGGALRTLIHVVVASGSILRHRKLCPFANVLVAGATTLIHRIMCDRKLNGTTT
jgi:hypothetical protein